MPKQCPLRGPEEWMSLDIGSTSSGTEAAHFVFDEEFADEGFAESVK